MPTEPKIFSQANTRNIAYEGYLTEAVGKGKKSDLPRSPNMTFNERNGNSRNVVVALSKDAVCQNMQTNAAAFESWILALKTWGVIDNVLLEWEIPSFTDKGSKWFHYQRFLYRVNFFRLLFGSDWFEVNNPEKLNDCETLKPENKGKFVLNIPVKNMHGTTSDSKEEAKLEEAFVQQTDGGRSLLGEIFGLCSVNRQLPVGLFRESKSSSSRIFPGGASAIDLVGLDAKCGLWIFELKKSGNAQLGVITELMFYAACMRDLRDSTFKFHDGKAGGRWVGKIQEIAQQGSVNAIFLLPEVHPLFRDKKNEILELLNNACLNGGIDIRFGVHEFSYSGSTNPVITVNKFQQNHNK
jgi:hypothetical protein